MNNSEQVGVISYKVEIDVESLKAGTKSAEQAVKTSFSSAEQSVRGSTGKMSKDVDNLTKRLNELEKGLRPIAIGAGIASAAVVAGFGTAARSAWEQVRAVENASFGLKAYEKDAAAVNTVLSELVQYARSDEGVLFQRQELFAAASALKGYGEATSQLTERVQTLAKGVAVGHTTFEELANIIGRTAQAGQLTAIAYDQLAYRGIILDSSLRGAAVSADELYEALENAIDDSIFEGRVNTIDGQLIRLQSAWRDLGSTILGVDKQTSQFIEGGLGNALFNTIGLTTEFIRNNQAMIAGVGASVVTFGTLAAVLVGAVKAITAVRTAIIALSAASRIATVSIGGVVGALSLLAGFAVLRAVNSSLEQATQSTEDFNGALDDTTNFSGAAADGVGDLTKRLQDLDKQIQRTERDYIENLTRIVRKHQQSVRDLTKQIEDENARYNRAIQERTRKFEDEQETEVDKHQEKTKDLQNQIDFLRKYNNKNNAQQLSELEFALARENAQYKERNAELQRRYQEDVTAEQRARDKKLADLNKQLAEEQGVLRKHRDSVKQVRNQILLDEIEMLKRSRKEQLESFEEQRKEIIKSAASAGGASGRAFGNAYKSALINSTKLTDAESRNIFGVGGGIKQTYERADGRRETVYTTTYNTGGFTGRGDALDPAGIVHRGEYVIPKPLVNQSTGLPKAEALSAITGGGSSTSNSYNIDINIAGAIVTSAQDQRKFAEVIGKRLNELMAQKGYKPSIQGV